MTVTALPPAPSRADPSTFSARADALLSALVSPFVTEVNATAATVTASEANAVAQAAAALASADDAAISAASAAAYDNATGTSTTSLSIGTGSKAFTTQTGKSWVAGMPIVAYFDTGNYLRGTVETYSGASLSIAVESAVGSGTKASWGIYSPPEIRAPIFSAQAATMQAVSNLETVENAAVTTGLTAMARVCYGNSLFVGSNTSDTVGSIVTSPDGVTYTLRTMPSSAQWAVGTNGTDKFMATVGAATTISTSTNGTVWAAATAAPGTLKNGHHSPVYNGATCLVLATAASTAYTTADNAASAWTTVTLPSTTGALQPFVVGGLFWYWNATTTAYTSATGATASWTSRALPITPGSGMVWQDFDGALLMRASADTVSNLYRSTDGINWTDLGFAAPTTSGSSIYSINGVYVQMDTTLGECRTRHNGVWTTRTTTFNDPSSSATQAAQNTGGTIFVFPSTGTTAPHVEPAATNAATAVFSR